jgi:hypothetical protein
MKKWAIVLIVLAGLDVLTTYFSLSLGSIEANPLFKDMSIGTMSLIKVSAYSLLAYISVRLKLRTVLIFAVGANTATVLSNLMAIWTLKTM